jgi:hypothetical protein
MIPIQIPTRAPLHIAHRRTAAWHIGTPGKYTYVQCASGRTPMCNRGVPAERTTRVSDPFESRRSRKTVQRTTRFLAALAEVAEKLTRRCTTKKGSPQ